MKCINAEWELRNLGVRTLEISIEKKDSELPPEEILDAIEKFRQEYDAKYVVVKSDTKYPSVSLILQQGGFLLIENQIGLKIVRKDSMKSFEEYKKFFDDEVSYRSADDDDTEMIFSEMAKGMFTTDRIALDPKFGIEVANRRYIFWMKDELRRGALLHIALYEGQPFGFFLDKPKGKNTLSGLLGGIFNQYKAQNLGAAYIFAGRKFVSENNYKANITCVSSNNLNILQLHLMFGYKITEITNVLVKHFD